MADLIDRQELKKRYSATAQSGGYLGDAMSIAINQLTRLLRLIDEAPTVEPKKGEWVKHPQYGKEWDVCSNCGTGCHRRYFENGGMIEYSYPYCPNCGADMRGEGDANNG